VPYASLLSLISKWYKWRYVDRRAVGVDGAKPHYVYGIAERGIHFVDDRIPADKYNAYIAEINAHRAKAR
ncbi:MAG: hypothetical protein V1823_05940, partial [Chloroflexota bacterium]